MVLNMRADGSCRPGLTILETVIALVVISFLVPLLIGLQIRLLDQAGNTFALIEQVTTMKNVFIEATQKKWFTRQRPIVQITENNISVTYKAELFDKAKLNNVVKESVQASGPIRITVDELIRFSFFDQSSKEKTSG